MNLIYYLTAAILGGLHGLEPGHGKTVVAAYLIGAKGRRVDAVLLGLVVTLTHTFSVIILAIIAKLASTKMTLTEESLHGYLGLVAGLLILIAGIWMLIDRIRDNELLHFHPHRHAHDHNHTRNHLNGQGKFHQHSHGESEHRHGADLTGAQGASHTHNHEHNHDPQGVDARCQGRVSYWQLIVLGLSGGLVPCPVAIAVLLASVASGRLEEGLTYILLFSVGLAVVLISIGLTVVGAGKLASRFLDAKKFARKISIASAAIITLLGVFTVLASMRHCALGA